MVKMRKIPTSALLHPRPCGWGDRMSGSFRALAVYTGNLF